VANESDCKKVKPLGLFVVPKIPKPPLAKVVTYTASGQVVIQSEFSDQLEELTKGYIAEYKPRGISELCLVRDLASAQCRCEYTQRLIDQVGDRASEKTIAALRRYQASSRGMLKRSQKLLKQIQKARAAEEARKPQLVKPKTIAGR